MHYVFYFLKFVRTIAIRVKQLGGRNVILIRVSMDMDYLMMVHAKVSAKFHYVLAIVILS